MGAFVEQSSDPSMIWAWANSGTCSRCTCVVAICIHDLGVRHLGHPGVRPVGVWGPTPQLEPKGAQIDLCSTC